MADDNAIRQRVQMIKGLGRKVCAALMDEILKLGFAVGAGPVIDWQAASFSLKRDPFSGEESVEGLWHDGDGQRIGMILFHAGGSFFAEYDVTCPHPSDERWFVEAVTAWGDGDIIKTEPRLLPALVDV